MHDLSHCGQEIELIQMVLDVLSPSQNLKQAQPDTVQVSVVDGLQRQQT